MRSWRTGKRLGKKELPLTLAILFDLDGVLIDSEPLHHEAFDRALGERDQPPISLGTYAEHFSSRGRGRLWIGEERPGIDYDHLYARKQVILEDLLRQRVALRAGARQVVERMGSLGPMAVATNSLAVHARIVLDKFGLSDAFRTIVGREDYANGKPAPDPFLEAARRLGVKPSSCVVIEDATKGVRAARAAGMRCVAVPSEYTAGGDFSEATIVLRSLDEITAESVTALFDGEAPGPRQGGSP